MKGKNLRQIFCTLVLVALATSLYRPLPATFTDSIWDRSLMYLMDGILRCIYVYPARLCADVNCELLWMRSALAFLMKIVGPWSMKDPEVQITDLKLDSIPTRVYVPYNRSNDGAIIYIHGGGYALGSMNMYESVVRQIAKKSKMVTFSLDYRLAPEHIFPAALDDCERFVLAILKSAYKRYDINRNRIALMGDSAGAGLVASLTFRLRTRKDIVQPKLQVLVYPLLQLLNLRTPSYDNYRRELSGTGFVDPRLVVQFYLMYAGIEGKLSRKITSQTLENQHLSKEVIAHVEKFMRLDLIPEGLRYGRNFSDWHHNYDENTWCRLAPYILNPEFTPLLQEDLSGVPEALVVTMEHDILRDEGILFARRLSQAGVATTWKHFDTGFHAMINFYDILSTSKHAVSYFAEWARDHV